MDFLAEIVDERTRRNPAFPSLMAEAEGRRKLARKHTQREAGRGRREPRPPKSASWPSQPCRGKRLLRHGPQRLADLGNECVELFAFELMAHGSRHEPGQAARSNAPLSRRPPGSWQARPGATFRASHGFASAKRGA
jgi:hypothetical protein